MALSLSKGQSISLAKNDGTTLTRVRLGLGWDEVQRKKRGFFRFGGSGGAEIDLDASAILLTSDSRAETVFFNHLTSQDHSVKHTGDNLTGAGDGDDEQIIVDLNRVASNVKHIVFTINSYSGQTFNDVENVFARVVDLSDGAEKEIVRYNLAESHNTTGVFIARLSRVGSGWEFAAIGQFAPGRTVQDMVNKARQLVA